VQTAVIGASLLRKEDDLLLRGRAPFADDLADAGTLHAHILRSPVAHGRIASLDATAALASPGVRLVLTADDLPPGQKPIPMRMFPNPSLDPYLQPPLARVTVRYSGEPIAVIVADSRYEAEDAGELVDLEIEPLDPVLQTAAAAAGESPLVHTGTGTNVAATFVIHWGDVDASIRDAAVVVEERFDVGRHAAVPLEGRQVIAEVDGDGILTVLGAAKIPHINRRILAGLLEWPEDRVRLVEVQVGGGFGGRGEFYPEDFLIPFCAVKLGRAVAWAEDREEHLRASNHSREQVHDVTLAVAADGRFLALRDRFLNNAGAYVRTHGLVVPGMTAALLPGPYRWPAFRVEANQVVSNKTPAGTYRAPGRYEANFVRERAIDIAARRLGLDPVEIRLRNLIDRDEMPYATGTHTDGHPVVYDSGDYRKLVELTLERFDREAWIRWRSDARAPHRRGIGMALFVEKSGIGRWEYARVTIEDDGTATVYTGSASLGQGLETVLAQICVAGLGISFDRVKVVHGDTALIPDGMGAFGSRATALGGAAVLQSAESLRARLLDLAADRLEIAPNDLLVDGDRIVARGTESRYLLLSDLQPDGSAPLEEEATFRSEDMSFPYGVHCAAVEVDVETGHVEVAAYTVGYDVGRAVNPLLVEGQIVGGAAQGLGGALFEELVYDEDGQLVAGSLMDYLVPTAGEVPNMDVLLTEDAPTSRNPLGAKGAGEGGTAATGAAISNAVADALEIEPRRLPLTPERIVALAQGRR
jgi:CO/xanthine dehydrogenase Mo-binding subunit